MKTFETLANELILEIFEYLNIFDRYEGFYDLNQRLNSLLEYQNASLTIDFRSISKTQFNRFSTDHLPRLIDQVTCLHLSNDDATPNLPEIFFSLQIPIDSFVHLESLFLYGIQSFKLFFELIFQCHRLTLLHHLQMKKCYFSYSTLEMKILINKIWTLPHLISCKIDQITSRQMVLTSLIRSSQTLKSLTLEKTILDNRDLSSIFHSSPFLQHFKINYLCGFNDENIDFPSLVSLTSLHLTFHGSLDALTFLFQFMPNVTRLELQIGGLFCDGHQWETILCRYFLHLEIFRFKMNSHITFLHEVEQILDTFRSSFWLEKHRWYVRCDWDPENIFHDALFYTLPYTFDDCFYFDSIRSRSTCPNQSDHWTYSAVKHLSHEFPENDQAKDSILLSTRFPKLESLKISFTFDQLFWSCLSSLEYLTSLHITCLHTDVAYDQLQEFLHRAKFLTSIVISHPHNLDLRFFSLTSSSLRRLNLISESRNDIRYFHPMECKLIAHSPLLRSCQVITMGIRSRRTLFDFISSINHFHSFICQCEDDPYNQWNSIDVQDEFIDWCRIHLISNHSIHRDEKRPNLVRFWIDHTLVDLFKNNF